MTAELGHLALWLALGTALLLAAMPLLGEHRGRPAWVALAQPLTGATAALVAAGYAALTAAFVASDFSVAYVAQHANSELPLAYRVAAVWGGHEGSLLLWVLLLMGWTLALRRHGRRHLPPLLLARSLAVLGALTAALLGFLLATSNPFERLLPALAEGRDLNPLLQDPGMVVHPPMLYMGYVGFAVVYALAMAALLGPARPGGDGPAGAPADHGFSPDWARQLRPWAAAAWACLTLGIALGSWWAYYELGWGGWWFWDPVENASFMPWLAGTALLHSLAVVDKRGAFRAWAVGLAIAAFALSLLGTFLVRSGVLSSVHAFATDPRRGLYILALLVGVVGGSLALYGARAHRLGLGARFHWRSRETALLANNLLLLAACGAVLLGTLYPLALDALLGQKISVGPPYFEAVFVPLMAPLLLLLGVGPLMRWKQDEPRAIARALRWPLLLAPLGTLAHAWAQGALPGGPGASVAAGLGLLAAWWVAATVVADLAGRLAPRRGDVSGGLAGLAVWWRRVHALPRSVAAMALAHAGVAVFIVGVTSVSAWQVEQDLVLAPGAHADVAGWRFQLQNLRTVEGPNYSAVRATVQVQQRGRTVATLQPEKRRYRSSEMPMTEAGIAPGLLRDLYVSLAEPVEATGGPAGAWLLRVAIKPAVNWVWGGCVMMALGGLLAASDGRYRRRVPAQQALQPLQPREPAPALPPNPPVAEPGAHPLASGASGARA